MAAFTLYPEELDQFHHIKDFKLLKQIRNKSIFSSKNLIEHSSINVKINPRNSNRVSKAFKPLRIILTLFGRWPFQPSKEKARGSHRHHRRSQITTEEEEPNLNPDFINPDPEPEHKNPIYQQYTPSLKSIFWPYFMLTTFFLSIVLIFSVLGFCDFFLEWHLFGDSSWDEVERINFESNLVPFVLVWSCLLHSSFSSISLFMNRKKVAKFLNYWNYAVEVMEIEVPTGIQRYAIINNAAYLGFLIVIFIAYRILYLDLVRGGATLVGILTFRPFISFLDMKRDLYKVRLFGVVTILYSVYASRAFLMLFSFKSKLLRHCFKIWNQRLRNMLRSSPLKGGYLEEQFKCEKLFEHYRVMLKLVRLTDHVFGGVLQSYYGSQLINMCFELYYLARSGAFSDSMMETFAATVVLVQNLFIFFTVSLDAASVNEEATRGFEILKSHGVSPNDSIPRKYLISNMQMIFTQKIVLTGGKFFSVDRPFIVTVLGAVLTYFIIVLQVGPSLHKKFETEPK